MFLLIFVNAAEYIKFPELLLRCNVRIVVA
ncbi:hypothetical protein AGR13a_Cc320035 [Agrobacterium genomosp. 13 str. CFBP 6927]|uniref:Uncharacterized protein n=1 Tax=Agrobacterium genomosp. 13 str. CFBP 6927 TaxID=1183428 RepID=A0ABM9VGB3_9HYPH|nr:hypothetical protein AGR13a_Cc320035 [Agrobacterium genomosp. 13 str. CFBP 6927]